MGNRHVEISKGKGQREKIIGSLRICVLLWNPQLQLSQLQWNPSNPALMGQKKVS